MSAKYFIFFEEEIFFKSMSCCFLVFSIPFVIGPISYQFFSSSKFECLYLGQKTAGEATFASPVGPRHP